MCIKKLLLLGTIFQALVSPALAQRVIVAGEAQVTPGTYVNVCVNMLPDTTWNLNLSECKVLGVSATMRIYSGAAWEVMQSGTRLAANSGTGAGSALVIPLEGLTSTTNISAATVVKAVPGRIVRVSVITAGSSPGGVHNTTTTGGASTANQVFVIPNAVGVHTLHWPMSSGVVVVPGTGQLVAVTFN